jgi:hypothetical protein
MVCLPMCVYSKILYISNFINTTGVGTHLQIPPKSPNHFVWPSCFNGYRIQFDKFDKHTRQVVDKYYILVHWDCFMSAFNYQGVLSMTGY